MNALRVPKKTNQKTFRFDDDVAEALADMGKVIEAPKLIRELILAAHRYYKENGERLYLPMELQPMLKKAEDSHQLKPTRKSA